MKTLISIFKGYDKNTYFDFLIGLLLRHEERLRDCKEWQLCMGN